MENENKILFKETQRLNQIWLWAIIVSVAILGLYGFIQQIFLREPFGSNPAPDWVMYILLILFTFCFPIFLYIFHLKTILTDEIIQIRFYPFVNKKFMYGNLISVEIITYKPYMDYGGYGIRWNLKGGMAYTTSGKKGVMLYFKDHKPILLGSQKADKLCEVINSKLTSLNK